MGLFDFSTETENRDAPLALRMRPRNFEEFVGQEHLVGPNKLLRQAIEQDRLTSLILWGPPGCGKTTLAEIIARTTKAHFAQISAVTAGVPELRAIIQEAKSRRSLSGRMTILFVDEIHRFNKAQQDALLPFVEDGTLLLVGATTENPFFEVIAPLVSRSRVFHLEPLSRSNIDKVVEVALKDDERGLGALSVHLQPEAKEFLLQASNGDARVALNALEWAALTAQPNERSLRVIGVSQLEEALQVSALRYDKGGSEHYDTISAFIKSMRGSDPDAALYWLARMIYAGEDPGFIARRVLICAAEDVGNADSLALVLAASAVQAVEYIGLPEAKIPLAQAVIYIACAPKSNSAVQGIEAALVDVKKEENPPVPVHLRGTGYSGARRLGHGKDYRYAHDGEGHFVLQKYLPEGFDFRQYYYPTDEGQEKTIKERLRRLWGKWKKYDTEKS